MRRTARLRNRIEAYLTGLAGAAVPPGIPGSWAQAPPGPGRDRHRIPGGGRVEMVNTANALHDLPVVKMRGLPAVFRGCMYQILAHAPAIDDFTTKEAAIVGLAETDRCLGGAPGTAGRR